MGHIRIYKCSNCGHEVLAPDNETGRYYVKAGTIQLFSCSSHHNIVSTIISQEYLNDEENDDEVNKVLEDIIESGDIRDRLELPPTSSLPEWMDEKPKRRKHKIQPWNARTGLCPKCGGTMDNDLDMPQMVVD